MEGIFVSVKPSKANNRKDYLIFPQAILFHHHQNNSKMKTSPFFAVAAIAFFANLLVPDNLHA